MDPKHTHTHAHTHTPKHGDEMVNHRLTTVSVLLSLHWCVCHARDILRFLSDFSRLWCEKRCILLSDFSFSLLRLVRWFGWSSDTEIATFDQRTCACVCVASRCKTQDPISALLGYRMCAPVKAWCRLEKICQFYSCPNSFIAYFLLNLFHTVWSATVYVLMTCTLCLHQQARTRRVIFLICFYTRLGWNETFQTEVFRQGSAVGYLRSLKQNIWHSNSCDQSEGHFEALTTFGQKFQIHTESSSSSWFFFFFFQWEL